jgi:hypothetical protein
MHQFSLWATVKVTSLTHPRTGQSGYVIANNPKHLDQAGVCFDSDSGTEVVALADLAAL